PLVIAGFQRKRGNLIPRVIASDRRECGNPLLRAKRGNLILLHHTLGLLHYVRNDSELTAYDCGL
ncbi:MAG: hypothetical protein KAW19_13260, partial [Candidatus Aminicenantes bacterium]|nr:hypothetical protein [Candidatus Aminicenantes bacterium]